MSDDPTTSTETNPNDENLRVLREQAATAKADREAAVAAQRELAFIKAGIEIDKEKNPVGELFYRTYDGEMTVDAIKAAAAPFGLTETVDPNATQHQQTRDLLTGAGAPGGGSDPVTPHPSDAALIQHVKDQQGGMSPENARARAFDTVLMAGSNGDKRVIYDESRYQNELLDGTIAGRLALQPTGR